MVAIMNNLGASLSMDCLMQSTLDRRGNSDLIMMYKYDLVIIVNNKSIFLSKNHTRSMDINLETI